MPNAVILAKSALSLLDLLDSVLEELYNSMNLESVEFYYKVLSLLLKEAGLCVTHSERVRVSMVRSSIGVTNRVTEIRSQR